VKFEQTKAPHWLGADPVGVLMRKVMLAMLPVIVTSIWFLGIGLAINLIFACLLCWLFEAASLATRGRPIAAFANDGSAIITALLIALVLPPNVPWWVTAVACLFAIIFAKHLYGGLGYNLFNPAMVGYVVVLVSFPEELAMWPGGGSAPLGLSAAIDAFLYGTVVMDALSGATPLDSIKVQLAQMLTMKEILAQESFGWIGGRGWEWINLAALAGGLWMLSQRVIRWHIPAGMLGMLILLYGCFFTFGAQTHPSPLIGLFSGGTMLAAFFVATDPVSAAASDRGRLIYGAGIGLLCFAVREWGAYPDGIAFAVLLMNMAAPLIDRYTLPRVYGHRERP
jgi:electron transport complex protein RnfD